MVKKRQGGGARSNTYFINFDHKVWHGDELEVAKLKENLLAGDKRTDFVGPGRLIKCPKCGGTMDKRSRCCKACVHDTGGRDDNRHECRRKCEPRHSRKPRSVCAESGPNGIGQSASG